ncbi:MAG: hypothetical protein GVY26_16910, partial [Bacteroidetes bacterium]|nr:hypothetical protein [Bacteroidota bacterium]
MRLIAYTLLLNSFLVFASYAQPQQFEPIPFEAFAEDETRLVHAFTGGMEAPQFRPFLLNADGFEDLLVFDRVGAKFLPFLAEPQGGGGIAYRYAPALEANLPTDLNQLLLVTDLNCDGWADIVSTREETSTADVSLQAYLREPGFPLQFSAALPLQRVTQDGQTTALHIHAYDVPVLKDLNGDERSDLLYIPIGGTHLQYYQQVGDCGALTFELADSCWGNASYTVEADFELQACNPGLRAQGCAGSVMYCRDYDSDGDQDLLFSGLYDEHILQLENAGSLSAANLVSQDISWINEGMGLTRFPSPFFVPYSDAQAEDLVIATNLITGQGYSSFNDRVLRFTLSSESDSWTLAEDQFLLDQMIDLGFRSNIALQDVNGDGLADLLIGYNDRHPIFSYTASIALFINTGTAQQPAFTLQTADWMGLSVYNFKSIAPAFGDFNGDGQEDLVVGLDNGDLRLFYRQGDAYLLADGQALHELSLNGLARPTVIDYDRDDREDEQEPHDDPREDEQDRTEPYEDPHQNRRDDHRDESWREAGPTGGERRRFAAKRQIRHRHGHPVGEQAYDSADHGHEESTADRGADTGDRLLRRDCRRVVAESRDRRDGGADDDQRENDPEHARREHGNDDHGVVLRHTPAHTECLADVHTCSF